MLRLEASGDMSLFTVLILLLLICFCKSDDQLTPSKPLLTGDTLVSNGGIFALGFFSLGNSTSNSYLGIWYHNIPAERTYVWVANRDEPITGSLSGKLVLTNSSDLVLSDSRGRIVWSTTNGITTTGSTAVLDDAGKFAIRSLDGKEVWQSLDHPTDTVLPGFKLWTNYKTHVAVQIVAWKGSQDPSTSKFFLSGDPSTGLQIFIWNGTTPYWRSGVWNGATASGLTTSIWSQIVDDGEKIYAMYNMADFSSRPHWKLDYKGNVKFRIWSNRSSSWANLFERPGNGCLHYGSCGPFGYCDNTGNVGECKCPYGFEPADGAGIDFSGGCVRREALTCGGNHHFLTLPGMKVPDKFVHMRNRSFVDCAAECDRDCSCIAYAYANLSTILTTGGGDSSRCLIWTEELVDSEKALMGGENLYLRLGGSPVTNKKSGVVPVFKIVLPTISCLLLLTCIYLICICKSRGTRPNKETLKVPVMGHLSTLQDIWDQNQELPYVRFEDIAYSTNNFHDTNILGQGGFGKVYKGTLEDGREVAVKRLSKGSEQGIEQFRNEVVLIAKLQHKNLVRLLGCCIHEDEKLLIYEYLPNKSLDKFLFDSAVKSMLDWPRRFTIIKGVARGLLYLHQDSRMTIIHRDLKPSNILLDAEINPKISDFGMARIFGGHEQQANTIRVVGTYGYMSPEYAMEGVFSIKSDTYSFGILLLEIVSGLKINCPHHLVMDFPNLITCAWTLWKEGEMMNFVDKTITENCSVNEVLKCVHIGLLCVQDSPDARPLMSSVVSMLENESMPRAMPKQPVYFAQKNYGDTEAREDLQNSVNDASLTMLEGR